jgi:hypothetical protein
MTLTKSAGAVVANNVRRMIRWKQIVRSLGAVTGLFATVGAGTSVAGAQDAGYRSAATAPASWQAFARQFQDRFEQRLAADDQEARSFQDYLTKREAGPDAPTLTFVARTWVLPDGSVERLEFDGLKDDQVAVHLRGLLTRDNVGAPPPDMLQPLRLRLSLRPKERPAGGK